MTRERPNHLYICNGATSSAANGAVPLQYLPGAEGRNVKIGLPRFVEDVNHLPPRILDLLEIAGYVFSADRLTRRGPKDALEYHAWARSMSFSIRVRDYDFWSQAAIRLALSNALVFMTGDAEYTFNFEPGHSTPPTSLFDAPEFALGSMGGDLRVMLFSGGLDSLAGAVEMLKTTSCRLVLVSHQSQPSTAKTQKALVEALRREYGDRVLHYCFECHLSSERASEETQRTRSFLFMSIACSIAAAYGKDHFFVFENGVTSINLVRREDLANGRASRTSHPTTIGRMEKLLSAVCDSLMKVEIPFVWLTKADVVEKLRDSAPELISSTVSCSRTFQIVGQATHCGLCFQCIDRRIAVASAGAESYDHAGLYCNDLITKAVGDREAETTALDYIRQAVSLCHGSIDWFASEYLSEVAELIDDLPIAGTDAEKWAALWELFQRHGEQVEDGLLKLRDQHDRDIFGPLPSGSLLCMVAAREYLVPSVIRLASRVSDILLGAIGDMFAKNKPTDEPDLNEKLGALLRSHEPALRSEHPTPSFACARVVPDHLSEYGLLIEAKYVRGHTPPSRATDGIAADLTKYPSSAFILFVVYDPEHAIPSDVVFRTDIERKGRNRVLIIR